MTTDITELAQSLKAAGYLAKFIVCQCHHSASTLMPASVSAR